MKKFLYIICIFIFCSAFTFGDKYSFENAILAQQYVENHRQNFAIVYNILNLEDDQILKTDEMMSKYDPKYDELSNKIIKETKKYEILKRNKIPQKETCTQKHIIKNLYSELNTVMKNETSEFMNVLNRKQRAKYHQIQHLEKHNYKQDLHPKKYMQKPYNF